MLRSALVAALAAIALPLPAEEVRLVRPVEAATLATGSVVFNAYFVSLPDDGVEVTAFWREGAQADSTRLTIRLDEGDAVSFSLPGHPETRFTLARDLDAVTVRATPVVRARRASL